MTMIMAMTMRNGNCKLIEKDKMSYYLFNKQEILQLAKNRYSKEKAAEYYLQNKEGVKEKSRERYKNISEEEKKQN